MFTRHQQSILKILCDSPNQAFSMSELGRLLGRVPGVFQRGLNTLIEDGYIVSRRAGNKRLLSYNQNHPLHREIVSFVAHLTEELPSDLYESITFDSDSEGVGAVGEPPPIYDESSKKILIIAGPNGAGKTTFAREFLPREGRCAQFINADYLAHALSPFSPEKAAMRAGRIMISELKNHIEHGQNVALETTLSGKRYARLIPEWQTMGYAIKLVFLKLQCVDMAIKRVATRVEQGGHNIPEQAIRRRFRTGRKNFENVYKPLVDAWALYDNSGASPVLIEEFER
jgi:predicted ABC-type ATPase